MAAGVGVLRDITHRTGGEQRNGGGAWRLLVQPPPPPELSPAGVLPREGEDAIFGESEKVVLLIVEEGRVSQPLLAKRCLDLVADPSGATTPLGVGEVGGERGLLRRVVHPLRIRAPLYQPHTASTTYVNRAPRRSSLLAMLIADHYEEQARSGYSLTR
jgi:hypothetical protein